MENVLKLIEESENNNPLLTAALEEIKRLNTKLEEIKSIAYGSNFSYVDDEDGFNVVPEADTDSHKIEIIQSMVMFR